MLHPKKVGALPVSGSDQVKQTNEIKVAAPMLEAVLIQGKTITADALLTQREFAHYLVGRQAHYHFTVKGNQAGLLDDLVTQFKVVSSPADYVQTGKGEHGRIETRKIWFTSRLNAYLDFPYVGQAFKIERESIHKKIAKSARETVYGITSLSSDQASAQQILADNRGIGVWKAAITSSTGTMTKTVARFVPALGLKI